MPRALTGLILAATLATTAASAQTLDGWAAFKFGMSPNQARAIPGQVFGRFSAKNIMNRNDGAMASKKPAYIFGVPYTFDLLFNAFQALNRISLWNEKNTSRADCEARFLNLVPQLEKSYGAFAPVYARHKRDDREQLPMSLEWKNTGGASRYQLATVYMGQETAYVWNARRFFDGRYVDAVAIWSAPEADAQAMCLTELIFKG